MLAPAQCGTHPTQYGKARQTHGHSLAVSPWGEILCDAGLAPGIKYIDLDLKQVSYARRRVPSLRHQREFEGP